MCVMCQAGPEIVAGVPVAGLALARLRMALRRVRDADEADDRDVAEAAAATR